MHWLDVVTLAGATVGLVGMTLAIAAFFHRDPNVPYTFKPVPVWRQRGWYTARGFRLRVLGEVLWTFGIFLCCILPVVVGWLD